MKTQTKNKNKKATAKPVVDARVIYAGSHKRKTAMHGSGKGKSMSNDKAPRETLEQRRQRNEEAMQSIERAARRAAMAISAKNKELIAKANKVKMPVTLGSVYATFVRRVHGVPIKVMRSEEPDQFGHKPHVLKIEALFLDLTMKQVVIAMEGLDERKAVTKMEGLSYSHIGQWGHLGSTIMFRVSMYRYKDRSCLFIFTPDRPDPPPKVEKEKPLPAPVGKNRKTSSHKL